LLKESVNQILQLKKEHNETLIKRRFDDSPFSSLSLVNPSILRLTEEEDKPGMSLLGPFFSNPPSPE
jgi:transcription termination factor NusB